MTTYDFTVVLRDSPELTDDLADRLYAAGCDDGTPGACGGVTTIDFHRAGTSLEDAIRSAIANVNLAGCTVERVQIEAENLAATSP